MRTPLLDSLPKKPFVILAYPRTGSYLLVSILDQFPGIKCHGEIFKKERIELPAKTILKMKATVQTRDAKPIVFIKRLFELTPDVHTGFKFFANHNAELRKQLMYSNSINRVITYRNPFDSYVSQTRAIATGSWIDKKGDSQADKPLLRFDPEQFDKIIRNVLANQARKKVIAEKRPDSTITITYDEIAAIDPVRKIAEFIGASSQPEVINVSLHKQTTERYSELFENFDELQAHIATHHPELMIDAEKI